MSIGNAKNDLADAAFESIGLLAIIQLVRNNVHWIVAGTVAGSVLAFAYCHFATRVYHSQSEILVMKKVAVTPRSHNSNDKQNVDEDVLATHLRILRSPKVVAHALEAAGLDQTPSVQTALEDDESPTEYVIRNLQTHKGGEGSGRTAQVLHLRLRHTNAADCQLILNAIVDAYRSFLKETNDRHNAEKLAVTRKKRGDAATELARTERTRREFHESSPFLWKGEESLNAPRLSAERLEAELTRLRMESIDVSSALVAIKTRARDKRDNARSYAELLPLVDPSHLDQLKLSLSLGHESTEHNVNVNTEYNQLLNFRIQRAELMTRYGAEHPSVVQLQRAIDETQRFLKQRKSARPATLDPKTVVVTYVSSLRSTLARLKRRTAETRKFLADAKAQAKTLIQFELRETGLLEQIAQQQTTLANHEKLVNDLELSTESNGFITKVIAPAQLGDRISPKPAMFLPLGAIIGCCFAIVIAILRDDAFDSQYDRAMRQLECQTDFEYRFDYGHRPAESVARTPDGTAAVANQNIMPAMSRATV